MSNQIAKLGDGEVFIKQTPSGGIKAVRAKLKLHEKQGHIAVIQGKAMITAAGYNEMNKFAGVSIITPEKLTLPDGTVVVNPYPIIDKESGSISKVWVKKIAIGYSPIGNLVLTSSTLLYDIQMYLIQDLMGKVQYNKSCGKVCMETSLTEEEKRRGAFYRIEGPLGIWVNPEDKEVLKAISTYINNKLFAERKAQTIAERNVLKKHPSLSQVYVETTGPDKNHVGMVDVYGWTHDLTREDLLKLAKIAEEGKNIENYKGTKVDIIDANVIDEIQEEDLYTSRDEEEITPELPESTGSQPMQHIDIQEREKVEVSNKQEKERENQLRMGLEESKNILGDEEFDKVIQENFRKPLEDLTVGQLEMAKALINSKLDSEVF
ncbi:hypothetical protein [Hathewaya massiliensis]|uniref:hypothetical protein n=1 Tax=Hathewaya massiliensis TaxID=1964382 RepID=UPI001A9BF740|nr:hypothetical protein [Hathewaya massiliensis]